MSNDKPLPAERFKRNLTTLISIINDMYDEGYNNSVIEEKTSLLVLAKLYISSIDADKMITRFIKKTHTHWGQIKGKDKKYFQDIGLNIFNIIQDEGLDKIKGGVGDGEDDGNSEIVNSVSEEQIENFKKLLEGEYEFEGAEYKIFDDEREGDIWSIMDSFVKISICYIHDVRREVDGEYTVDFMPQICVSDEAKKWGISSF
jgi:hypothetical protein